MRCHAGPGEHDRASSRSRAAGLSLLLGAALAVVLGSVALAFWTGSSSSNPATAVADNLPKGQQPSSAVVGPSPNSNTATVSFAQAMTAGGTSVPATNTMLRRLPEAGGAATTVTAACTGTGTVVCTESGVPDGRWVYTDAPTFGTSWTGTASDPSPGVTVDTTGPVVTVDEPVDGTVYGVNYSGVLGGTAADSLSAVSSVEVAVEDTTTQLWWNGAEFSSATPVFGAADGTTVWTFALPASDLVSMHGYALHTSATDSVGNVAAGPVVAWSYDTTPPPISITAPMDGTPFGADWPGVITGTASAAPGLSVADVDLAIHDLTADSYWNGVTWQPTEVAVEAPPASSWSYALAGGELTTKHFYTVTATAVDTGANVSSTAPVAFSYDTSLPLSVVAVPADAATYGAAWPGAISGTAAATDGGVLPEGATVISIEDVGTGYFWNGTDSTTTQSPVWIHTSGSTSWSVAFPASNLDSDHTYRIIARTTCSMANVGFSTPVSFDFDLTPPEVAVTSPAHGRTYGVNWSGAITGTASADPDFTLALDSVTVAVRDTSTGLWWDGTSFAASSQTFVPVTSGLMQWSLTLGAGSLSSGDSYSAIARAVDSATNSTDSTTVTWGYDTTAPSIAITAPTNGSHFGGNWPGAVTGTVSAASGLSVNDVDLTVHDVTADSYWNGVTWQPTAVDVEAPTTASWSYGLAAGELTSTHTYTVKATATDTGANVSVTATNTFTYDTTPPISIVTSPVDGVTYGANWSGTITGTASAPAIGGAIPEGGTLVSIEDVGTGYYWNGTNFTSTQDPVWVATTGSTSWSLAFPASRLVAEHSYRVISKTTGIIGNTGESTPVDFDYSGIPPTNGFDYPANGVTYGGNWSGVLSGNAAGHGSATIPAASATGGTLTAGSGISIIDTTANEHWNGSAFVAGASPHFNAVSGTTAWSYALAAGELTTGHSYSAVVQTIDSAGNSTTSTAVTFAFDGTPPSSTVTVPGNGSTYGNDWPGSISGTAAAGSGLTVASVALAIEDTTASKWWTGTTWSSTATTVAASGTTSWSTPLPLAVLEGTHHYRVTPTVTDDLGNTDSSTVTTWTISTTPPGTTVTYPVDGTTYGGGLVTDGSWAGTIEGFAHPTNGSIASVGVTIQRTSDSWYWNGTTWQSGTVTVPVTSGTTAWTYTFAESHLTSGETYSVVATATDDHANVATSPTATWTYDTTAPTVAVTYPVSGTAYGINWTGPVAGTAAANTGTLAHVDLTIRDTTTGLWWNGFLFSQSSAVQVPTTVTGASWTYPPLTGAELTSGHGYTVSATVTDSVGNAATGSVVAFSYDTTVPVVAVTVPVAASTYGANWPGVVSGSASAAGSLSMPSGSTSVTITNSLGYYFNGTDFTTTQSPVAVPASGGGSWSLGLSSSTLASGLSYTVTATSTDSGGNVGISPSIAFTYDATPPTNNVDYPVSGRTYGANWTGTLAGNAAAHGTLSIPVSVASGGTLSAGSGVSIVDTTAGTHFNGSSFVSGSGEYFVATAGSTSAWTSPLAAGKLVSEHSYNVTVATIDSGANTTTSAASTFVYDPTAPTAAVTSPVNATTYGTNWTGTITGTASAHGTLTIPVSVASGGTLSAGSGVSIIDTTAGTHFNGSSFVSGSGAYYVATAGSTSAWSSALAGAQLASGHSYGVTLQTIDSGGNAATGSVVAFSYDTTVPVVAVTVPVAASTYGANWPGVVSGSASAAGSLSMPSGSTSVTITNSLGYYFNGTDFTTTQSPVAVPASGGGSWSLGLSSSTLASGLSYTVTATSTDSGGNVGISPSIAFTYDATPPTNNVDYPVSGRTYGANWTGTLAGNAAAHGTLSIPVSVASGGTLSAGSGVSIVDTTAGTHFNGSSFVSGSGEYFVATAGSTSAWTSPLAAGKLVSEHSYNVTVATIDSGANTTTSAASTFVYDPTAPTAAVTSPVNATTYGTNWTGTITGTATANASGTTISRVALTIADTTNATWWNGLGWQGTTTTVVATGSTSWSYALAGGSLISNHSYAVVAAATDSGGNAASSASVPFNYFLATKLVFTTQPTSATAGVAIAPSVVVAVEDAAGNVGVHDNTTKITIAVGTNPGGATLSGGGELTVTNGVAAWSALSLNRSGTGYTLTATDTSGGGNGHAYAAASSSTFTITAGAAAKLGFSTQPGGGSVSTAWSVQPVVTIQDALGNTVTGNTSSVTLAIGTNPGSGTLSCTTNPVAAIAGVATFSGCRIDKVGSGYTLVATDGALSTSTSSAFAVTPGAAAKLAFSVQTTGGTGGTAWATQPVVTVQDASGNTVTTDTSSVTLAIQTNPGSGTLSCTTNPVTAVAGVATFSGCSITKTGTGYTLRATDGALTAATSSAFTITLGPAAKLGFTTQPVTTIATGTFAPKIAIQDAGGNTVTTDTSTVTIAITGGTPATGGPGTLTCTSTLSVAAVSGVANFAGCSIHVTGTGYSLTATRGALAGAVSSTFNITPGAAASMAFTPAPPSTVVHGVPFTVTATLKDTYGNVVTTNSTSAITLSLASGSGTLSGGGAKTVVNGVTSWSVSYSIVGSFQLRIQSSGLTTVTSGTITAS